MFIRVGMGIPQRGVEYDSLPPLQGGPLEIKTLAKAWAMFMALQAADVTSAGPIVKPPQKRFFKGR